MKVKFVSYNTQYSLGKDGRFDLERIVDAVREADVIALQEVTRNFGPAPDVDQPARIAELLPELYWIYGPPVDVDASNRDADGRVINRRMQFGNMLLSRWPILSSRLLLLPRMRTYERHNFQCGALEGIVVSPGGALRIYCVHLNHLHHEERLAQIDFLLSRLPDVPREGVNVSGGGWQGVSEVPVSEDFMVLGDCNLTPDSREYARIVGEPDYFYAMRVASPHLVDTWVQAGHSREEGVTWHDEERAPGDGLRIDYGFVSAGLVANVTSAWIDDGAVGSDHQPVWFELDLS